MKVFIEYGDDDGMISDESKIQDLLQSAIRAGNESIVRFFIEKGAKLEFEDFSEDQPLPYATECGQLSMVKLLLDHGCNPFTLNHISDKYGPSSA